MPLFSGGCLTSKPRSQFWLALIQPPVLYRIAKNFKIQKSKNKRSTRSTNQASVVCRLMTPSADPPTIRENPRRVMSSYVALSFSESGLAQMTLGDIYGAFANGPQSFKGSYYQINKVSFWGPSGLTGGSSVSTRLHVIYLPDGTDGDDRGSLNGVRPRVGFNFPQASRKVHVKEDETRVFYITSAPTALRADTLACVVITGW